MSFIWKGNFQNIDIDDITRDMNIDKHACLLSNSLLIKLTNALISAFLSPLLYPSENSAFCVQ